MSHVTPEYNRPPEGEEVSHCSHLYSRQINQPYPRHCINCGEVELSEQSKPTTDWTPPPIQQAIDNVNQQCTGEWTPSFVAKLVEQGRLTKGGNGWNLVAKTHNAALAAAYKQGYNDCDCELNGKVANREIERKFSNQEKKGGEKQK